MVLMMSWESKNPCEKLPAILSYAFIGCDTVTTIAGHGKATLFDKFCAGDVDEHMDNLLDVHASRDVAIRTGISIFQYI